MTCVSIPVDGGFLDSSDFYTLDVADFTGKPADEASIQEATNSPLNLERPTCLER